MFGFLGFWGPIMETRCFPNFTLTVAKFVFSNSGNFSLHVGQRQFRQSPYLALNPHSGNEWGKIPVLTGHAVLHMVGPSLFPSILSKPCIHPRSRGGGWGMLSQRYVVSWFV